VTAVRRAPRGWGRALLLALTLGALDAGASAQPLDVRPEEYRQAAAAGAVGGVAGRTVGETGRRAAPELPLADVSVTLLPRSEALLARLADIKTMARRDLGVYRESARRIADARRQLERALTEAGAGDLVRYTAVAPDGTFEVEGLPAGRWLLLAQRAEFVSKPTPPPRPRESTIYRREPLMKGYYAVTLWLEELTIAGGQSQRLELSDRNAWMTAIVEERALDSGAAPSARRSPAP
jgi:rhodanese-related sulfurtransferase